jgi:hypothetical protein
VSIAKVYEYYIIKLNFAELIFLTIL